MSCCYSLLVRRHYKHSVDVKCSYLWQKRFPVFHFAMWYKVLQILDNLNEQEELISAPTLLSSQRHTFTGIAAGWVQEGKRIFFFLFFYFTVFLVIPKLKKKFKKNLKTKGSLTLFKDQNVPPQTKRKQNSQPQFIKEKYTRKFTAIIL